MCQDSSPNLPMEANTHGTTGRAGQRLQNPRPGCVVAPVSDSRADYAFDGTGKTITVTSSSRPASSAL